MKHTAKILILAVALVALGGCGLFKDTCDCPRFGYNVDKPKHPGTHGTIGSATALITDDQANSGDYLHRPIGTFSLLSSGNSKPPYPFFKN